jgi:hypothetical protein
LTKGPLEYLVLRWFQRAGIAPPPRSLAHALRHTPYATLLVDTWASPPEDRPAAEPVAFLTPHGVGVDGGPFISLLGRPAAVVTSRTQATKAVAGRGSVRPLSVTR